MHHNELLNLLNGYAQLAGLRMDRNAWLILVDVVELHGPIASVSGQNVCSQCFNYAVKYGEPRKIAIYPCTTIKTIVKELT